MRAKMLWRNSIFPAVFLASFFWFWLGLGVALGPTFAHFCRFVYGCSTFRSPNSASQGRFCHQLDPNFASHQLPAKMAGGRRYSPVGASIINKLTKTSVKRGRRRPSRPPPSLWPSFVYFVDCFTIYLYNLYLFCTCWRTFTLFEHVFYIFTALYICFIFVFLLRFYRNP